MATFDELNEVRKALGLTEKAQPHYVAHVARKLGEDVLAHRARRLIWNAILSGRISVHQRAYYERAACDQGLDVVKAALGQLDRGKFDLATRRLTPEEERAAHLHGIAEDRFAAALVYLEAGQTIRDQARRQRAREGEQKTGYAPLYPKADGN
ncbi:MAG: hypothetical protein R6X33_00195 [Candidatus Brocadiia bacterium]